MDERIATLNIEHLRKELARVTEPAKRKALRRLLAEEENKLATLSARRECKGRN